jgi:hypothetical protein
MTPASWLSRTRFRAILLQAWLYPLAILCLGIGLAHGLEIKSEDDPNNTANKVVTLRLSGQFEQGDGLRVRALVAKLPSDVRIVAHFNAGGGVVQEAMSIGRFFHQLGVVTEVPPKAQCLSPCPLAFLGGYDPKGGSSWIKHTDARFGFTPFSANAPEKDYTIKDLDAAVSGTQQSILQVMDYLTEVNADLDILRRIYEDIPSGTVRYIADEDLLSLGISIYDDKSNQLIEAKALQRRTQR